MKNIRMGKELSFLEEGVVGVFIFIFYGAPNSKNGGYGMVIRIFKSYLFLLWFGLWFDHYTFFFVFYTKNSSSFYIYRDLKVVVDWEKTALKVVILQYWCIRIMDFFSMFLYFPSHTSTYFTINWMITYLSEQWGNLMDLFASKNLWIL